MEGDSVMIVGVTLLVPSNDTDKGDELGGTVVAEDNGTDAEVEETVESVVACRMRANCTTRCKTWGDSSRESELTLTCACPLQDDRSA
jgi:hypothetical protein